MTLPRYEVVESRVWKNSRTGQTASIYGAVPYQNDAGVEGWSVEMVGYTIRDNVRGTVGIGRQPFTTKGEAHTFAQAMQDQIVFVRPANEKYPEITVVDVRAYRASCDAEGQALCDRALEGEQDAWWLVKGRIAEQRHLSKIERDE